MIRTQLVVGIFTVFFCCAFHTHVEWGAHAIGDGPDRLSEPSDTIDDTVDPINANSNSDETLVDPDSNSASSSGGSESGPSDTLEKVEEEEFEHGPGPDEEIFPDGLLMLVVCCHCGVPCT